MHKIRIELSNGVPTTIFRCEGPGRTIKLLCMDRNDVRTYVVYDVCVAGD